MTELLIRERHESPRRTNEQLEMPIALPKQTCRALEALKQRFGELRLKDQKKENGTSVLVRVCTFDRKKASFVVSRVEKYIEAIDKDAKDSRDWKLET